MVEDIARKKVYFDGWAYSFGAQCLASVLFGCSCSMLFSVQGLCRFASSLEAGLSLE